MDTSKFPDECCGRCFYMHETELDQKTLTRQTVCRQGPPQTNMVYSQGGAGLICGPPPVNPATGWCGQFKRKMDT